MHRTTGWGMSRIVWCAGALMPMAAVAQDSGLAPVAVPFETAVSYAVTGVYVLLGGLSVLALALIIYFLTVLRNGSIAPAPLHRELMQKLQEGNYEDARRLCSFRGSALSAVMLCALDHLRTIPDADATLLREVVEAEGSRQAASIEGHPQLLMDIAVVAPMVGLLGTVFGMLIAFNAVSDQIAVVRPTVLVGGVNQAMITTAFGLLVGIPAMMFYAFFRSRASKLVSMLETASAELMMVLLSRRPKK